MGRGPRDGGERKGMKKRIEMRDVHVPTPHNESDHRVPQTNTDRREEIITLAQNTRSF